MYSIHTQTHTNWLMVVKQNVSSIVKMIWFLHLLDGKNLTHNTPNMYFQSGLVFSVWYENAVALMCNSQQSICHGFIKIQHAPFPSRVEWPFCVCFYFFSFQLLLLSCVSINDGREKKGQPNKEKHRKCFVFHHAHTHKRPLAHLFTFFLNIVETN